MKHSILILFIALSASAAFAHSGVKNAAVKARMDSMSAIGDHMKTIGEMSKGARGFDKSAARFAAAGIAKHAAKTPALFEAKEDDPKSEAKAAIWTSFDDFTAKANEMEEVAVRLSKSIGKAKDLGPAVNALGETCKSCHSAYRE